MRPTDGRAPPPATTTPGHVGHPRVLAYHAVAVERRPGLDVSMVRRAEDLAADVAALRAEGRRIITAGQLSAEVTRGGDVGDTAVLTFDDGWADALTVAAPLLARLGVSATFFVCPGLFGNREPTMSPEGRMLTAAEAVALHRTGMEVASHSVHHPDLRALDDASLAEELGRSRAAVEALTGARCRTFAYPFGMHDARVRAATRTAGYELAFTYSAGPWNRMAVPREAVKG